MAGYEPYPQRGVYTKMDKIGYVVEVWTCFGASEFASNLSIEPICHESKYEESCRELPILMCYGKNTGKNPADNTETGNEISEVSF